MIEKIYLLVQKNDVYVLGTPKMIILGNKFDGINYEIEDVNNNTITKVTLENILHKLEINCINKS